MDDEEIIEKALKVVNDEIELLPSHEILSKEMYEHICLTLKEIKNILETKKNLRNEEMNLAKAKNYLKSKKS